MKLPPHSQNYFFSSFLKKAFVFLSIFLFLTYKLSSLEYRFGDQNAYFYMARAILEGNIPYRDFILADPPLLVYLLSISKKIIGNNVLLFSALPPFFDALSGFILYIYLKRKNISFSFLAPAFYLFSFLILSTSDYVTGLHLVLFLINLALLFEKIPTISGFFWGLATLIKLYSIPGFLIFSIWSLKKKNYKYFLKLFISYCLTGLVVMLPFLLISPEQVIDQIVIHQFNRPAGIVKSNVFYFFFVQDFPLIILGLIGLIWKKNWQILTLFLSWIFFYLIFKDLYYVYLGILTPWLTIGLVYFLEVLKNKWNINGLGHKLSISLILLIFLAHLPAFSFYHTKIRLDGKFTQAKEVSRFVNNLEPALPLYGSHEVAPLIALLTNKELFNRYLDTNTQIFSSGLLDKKQVSLKTVESGIYLLTKVTNLPINAKLDSGYEGYFDSEIFEKYCQRLTIINGLQVELFTDVAIYRCQKEIH